MGTVEKKNYPKLREIENEIKSLKIMIIKSQRLPKKSSKTRRFVKRS